MVAANDIGELRLDRDALALLDHYGFDRATFDRLRERLRRGDATDASNRIGGVVAPPAVGDVRPLPPLGTDSRRHLWDRGIEALGRGEVAAVVLAGGMATRFGGVVKAAVKVVSGLSFLDLKLADVQAAATKWNGSVPVYVMTSFATHAQVSALCREASTDLVPVEAFPQFISLRMTEDGQVFRDSRGRASPYAPGHGDLSFALRSSGILGRFIGRGGRMLFMSNVDNLTATLDPSVVGAHLENGAAITAEVAPKETGDRGGAPARVDGKPQIVEAFRFPEGFDPDRIPVFNTNSFVIDAHAIDRDIELTWLAVRKSLGPHTVVQFERLVGELTAFLPSGFLRVERYGVDARFQPVKDPAELERRRQDIVDVLGARGIM